MSSAKKAAPAASAAKKSAAAKKSGATKAPTKKAAGRTKKFDPSGFVCNVVPSKDTSNDWSYVDSVASGSLGAVAAPPPSVDLRAPWWTINNQEQTGSCVGWATADGVGRYHMVKAGKLAQTQLLSPRFVWMASKETDSITNRPETFIEGAGTTLKAAADVVRKYGLAMMDDLPFHLQTAMFLGNENTFYASCAQRKVAAYFNLRKDVRNWRTWLASNGPILVGLSVDSAWDNAGANGGNIDTFDPLHVRGGHAVALVGYRDDGRFIVRNSWGTTWGDQGYGYVSEAYVAASFFNESYGFTV